MKVSLDAFPGGWRSGQTLRGEVLASDESGSLLMVDGRPVTTAKRLEAGKTFTGRVEVAADGRAGLALESDAVSAEGSGEAQLLRSWGLEPTAENQTLVRLLRRFGLPVGAEGVKTLQALMTRLGAGLERPSQDALGLLLARRLPEGAFPLLAKYFAGDLTFARLLEKLPAGVQESLRDGWGASPLLDHLQGLLADPAGLSETVRAGLAEDFPAGLLLQEVLSQPPGEQAEGRLFFQWPVYWDGADLPDTLEGEAFYEGGDGPERGFSLRLRMHPPRLGRMEVGLHRLKEALWVHFGLQETGVIPAVRGLFPALEGRLQEMSWRSVRLTAGRLAGGERLLAPPEPEPGPGRTGDRGRVDVRV
ncbi:MAG: hypothetical protein GX442_02220 [Candidatus Riflebacteria bacterium]|nr:hypothetical protein [Candidatus Riflebacteria bacterium]